MRVDSDWLESSIVHYYDWGLNLETGLNVLLDLRDLQAALRRYGRHEITCVKGGNFACTCGFDDVLGSAPHQGRK